MSKRAFDKIRAGLESTRSYLDGSADKTAHRVHVPETLDEMGPGVEAVPARKDAPRSTMGRPGMRGGFKPRRGR
jgi:hypothetical protein